MRINAQLDVVNKYDSGAVGCVATILTSPFEASQSVVYFPSSVFKTYVLYIVCSTTLYSATDLYTLLLGVNT